MTSNQEIVTRLEISADNGDEEDAPSAEELFTRGEKAAIFDGVRDFFSRLTASPLGRSIDAVTADTIVQTLDVGSWVDEIDQPAANEKQSFFLHSLERPLLDQVRDRIRSRGESIEQVDIVAPFFGTSLRVPEIFTDDGIETRLWLQDGRAQIDVAKLDGWLQESCSSARSLETTRYLHGKLLYIRTDNAAYCLSGSQNASYAVLLASAGDGGGNVEAAVLRRVADHDYFEYLFQNFLFNTAEPLDVDAFEAAEELGLFGSAGESIEDQAEQSLQLHGVNYRRSGAYDGGRLTIHGTTSEADRNVIKEEGAALLVSSSGTVSTTKLRTHRFEWESTADGEEFEYTTDLFGDQAQKPYIRTGTAHLRVGDSESNTRWIQTQSPVGGGPIPEDIIDAGATAVATSIPGLFDTEERMEIISSLNAILTALRDHDVDEIESPNEPRERDLPESSVGSVRR